MTPGPNDKRFGERVVSDEAVREELEHRAIDLAMAKMEQESVRRFNAQMDELREKIRQETRE